MMVKSGLVLGALVEKRIPDKNIKLITQGDAVDYANVIEWGAWDIYVNLSGTARSVRQRPWHEVHPIEPGDSLMQNSPSAATGIPIKSLNLLALDYMALRRILMDCTFQQCRFLPRPCYTNA